MADSPHVDRGTIITYVDDHEQEDQVFRRAVVTGPGVLDPGTDAVWIPVVRPDCEVMLLDPERIVDIPPAPGPTVSPEDAVGVLARALTTLAEGVVGVEDSEPAALPRAQGLLADFVRTIRPIENALCRVVQAEPAGAVATALSCLSAAADEFEDGNLTDAKVGILIADSAVHEVLSGPLDDDSDWFSDDVSDDAEDGDDEGGDER